MKQRVISGAVCVVALAVVLCLYHTLALEAAVCALSAIAVYELLTADGFREHRAFLLPSVIFAGVLPYASCFNCENWVIIAFLALIVLLMLAFHESVSFEKVSFLVLAALFVPISFISLLRLRNNFARDGLFYLLMVFGGAWFADTGAFFVGKFFGKHKLSPKISPKKTVEGAVGGVLTNVLLFYLMALIYAAIRRAGGISVQVHYVQLIVLAVGLAVCGMVGDLLASVIKRQLNIKDYGKCIPGHGGIMDRFDSILFTAPAVYAATKILRILG